MKQFSIFTDGSCYYQIRRGGYGIYIVEGCISDIYFSDPKESYQFRCGYDNTTISRMELRAIIEAVRWISDRKESCSAIIYSDSEYIVNALKNGSLLRWKNEGWTCKNRDLWIELDNLLKEIRHIPLKIKHTRGHRKDLDNPIAFGNAVADDLANYKTQKQYIKDIIK